MLIISQFSSKRLRKRIRKFAAWSLVHSLWAKGRRDVRDYLGEWKESHRRQSAAAAVVSENNLNANQD